MVLLSAGLRAQPALAAPVIDEESTTAVSQTAATLQAEVNPNGADTRYRFEYGPTTAYGKSAPLPDKDIGTSEQTVSVLVTGLVSGSTYHFRVVASNSEGVSEASDFVFTTHSGPSSFVLPDKRAYELVTPTDKAHNSSGVRRLYFVETQGFPEESSAEGNAVNYLGEDFYEALGGEREQTYLSTRGPSGWTTTNAMSSEPFPYKGAVPYVGFSPATATGVVSAFESQNQEPLGPGVPPGFERRELYLRHSDGTFTPLITATPPGLEPGAFGRPMFVGASSDYSHVFFETAGNLYEWAGGTVRLVNVLPDGSSEPGASLGIEYGDFFGSLGSSLPNLSNAISPDGTRVFWTDQNDGDLYVRDNNAQPPSPLDGKGRCTVPADACTVLIAEGAQFQTASTDASKVFFTKAGDLYEQDLGSGQTIDLAPSGAVQGLAGTSDDGTYIYFVASAALAPGASAGQPNLYLSHAGTTSYIATLGAEDGELNSFGEFNNFLDPASAWSRTFAARLARVSPDGRYLAFASSKQLTSYPPVKSGGPIHGAQLVEIYIYDSASGRLQCASCRSDGQHPTVAAWLPPEAAMTGGLHQPRWLDDSGQVFFYTTEELTPGTPFGGLYEYESGHDYLLAPNQSEQTFEPTVSFLDASESGNDVFFRTTDQLVAEDQDGLGDIYDARVNGGFAPPVPVPCVADACHGEPTPPFGSPSLATATSGPSGNIAATASEPEAKPKPLTRAQMFAKALKACKGKSKKKRATCEAQVRQRYGRGHKVKKMNRKGN